MWYRKAQQEIEELANADQHAPDVVEPLQISEYCNDCGKTTDEADIDYDEWFDAFLCPDCHFAREEEREAEQYSRNFWGGLSDKEREGEILRAM